MVVGTRILIVDDNNSLAKTVSFILKKKGYETLIANTGSEALTHASANQDIDVVLMDIKMPDMNGVETFKKMKEMIPKAEVIMMTAYAVEDLIAEAMLEGAYGVIYKPLDIDKSIRLIEDAKTKRNGAFILIVDDNLGTLSTFKNILIRKGYEVLTTTEGVRAVEPTKENNFDIIFLDLKLPTINGFETYLKIREIKPDTIAVLITGYYESKTRLVEQALLASMYTCLQKPLDMSKVLTLIEKLTSEKGVGG